MFEVFHTINGRTVQFAANEAAANAICDQIKGTDYAAATPGFYIKRQARGITEYTGQRFHSQERAERHVNFENMASDYATYSFVEVQ